MSHHIIYLSKTADAFYHAIACNATHGIAKAFLSVCLFATAKLLVDIPAKTISIFHL